jgi:hypothetical protein
MLDDMEIQYIQKYNCLVPNGYNLRLGGNGGTHNAETKQKIAETLKLKYDSGLIPRNQLGKPLSEITKKKLSECLKGRRLSQESINKRIISSRKNKIIQFEILDKLVLLAEYSRGWGKELNVVKWRDNTPKFDLRVWSKKHTRMTKGLTLSLDELYKLYMGLDNIFNSYDSFANILNITSVYGEGSEEKLLDKIKTFGLVKGLKNGMVCI